MTKCPTDCTCGCLRYIEANQDKDAFLVMTKNNKAKDFPEIIIPNFPRHRMDDLVEVLNSMMDKKSGEPFFEIAVGGDTITYKDTNTGSTPIGLKFSRLNPRWGVHKKVFFPRKTKVIMGELKA